MADGKIDQITTANLSGIDYHDMAAAGNTADYPNFFQVNSWKTDGPTGDKEFEYTPEFDKWHGYYRKIPEVQAVIDKIASWTVGKGFKADEATMTKVKALKGFGKDDFNSLLENLFRTCLIAGDSFAEVVRYKSGKMANLKPLNPGSIKIICDQKGMLKRYEQFIIIDGQRKVVNQWKKEEIFHLSWNRIADEVHGIPFCEKLESLIHMRNEGMNDLKVLFHRYVVPVQIIPVKTDDETEINTAKSKYKEAYRKSEPIFVPHDTFDTRDMVSLSIPQYSSLDPLPWLKYLIRVFTTSAGVPEVVMGWGKESTEATSKILYLAFQQTIERSQRFLEEQLRIQLSIKIELEFPASIEPEITGENKGQGVGSGSSTTQVKSLSSDQKRDTKLNRERKSELQP